MSDILVEHQGAIATVVFNRPRMRNALNLAMWADLASITQGLVKDDSVRAIVYRGAGRQATPAPIERGKWNRARSPFTSARGPRLDCTTRWRR